jgi:predicted enzyme related to lactoylglutathione lyase
VQIRTPVHLRTNLNDEGGSMNKLVHWDIQSTDLAKSRRFYEEIFGWTTRQWAPDYSLFEVEAGVGGGISLVDKMPEPCIEVYIEVEDIPASLAKAVELGGAIVGEKTEIDRGMGFLARFTDSCGCLMGLWSKG